MGKENVPARPKNAPPVEPTKEELAAQIQKLESEKEQNFLKEYNELCDKYGYQIKPYIQLKTEKLIK